MIIRDLCHSDVKRLVQLEEELLGETIGEAMLKNEMHNQYAKFLVASTNDQAIGYIGGWCIEDELEIINFVVASEYWHQRVGQKLFTSLVEYAKGQGAKKVTLEVKENNYRAIMFYEKQGLKQNRVRYNYYHDGQNAIVMMKVI